MFLGYILFFRARFRVTDIALCHTLTNIAAAVILYHTIPFRRHHVCLLFKPLTARQPQKHMNESLFFREAEKISSSLPRFQHSFTQLKNLIFLYTTQQN